jgi:hypothetical protein
MRCAAGEQSRWWDAMDCRTRWRHCLPAVLCAACIASWAGHAQVSAAETRSTMMHADGSYETAYAWSDGGNYGPDYGAFAERYEGLANVGAIVVDLTSLPGYNEAMLDLYIWADGGGAPGSVLFAVHGVSDILAGMWPLVTRNVVGLPESVCVDGTWWVGYWGDYAGWAPFLVGADLDGAGGGASFTRIAPGQGFPTGWQDVSVRWGPTAALGIGAEVDSCPPTPTQGTTWGAIKAMFRE